jgi:protein TonB
MNNRKSKSIEKRRILNIEVGLVAALSLLLVAFSWNSNTPSVENMGVMIDIPLDQELIQTTKREEIKKPKLPKKIHVPQLTIVDNSVEEDSIEIDTEFDPDRAIAPADIFMEDEVEEPEEDIFVPIPEVGAEFRGGELAMYGWLKDNLRFPQEAIDNGITGIVYVQFKIGVRGEIYDIAIMRSPDEILTQEALRVVRMMPNWKPATQGGKKVKTIATIPINFNLK